MKTSTTRNPIRWVSVLMGSATDWPIMQAAIGVLEDLAIDYKVLISSAHRTPQATVDHVKEAEANGCVVFICGAGMAAHLAGAVAAQTIRPVIGVPLPGGGLGGLDALLSTVQMPGGVPVATVALGKAGAVNAAYLAAQILAIENPILLKDLQELRTRNAAKVVEKNIALQQEISGGPGDSHL